MLSHMNTNPQTIKMNLTKTIHLFAPAMLTAVVLSTGCTLRQAYPETQISGYLHGQPFSIHAPKDSTLTGLDVVADTNGSVRVHIDHLQCSINPTNLANAAEGQAAIVNATGEVISKAFNQALQVATKSAGAN